MREAAQTLDREFGGVEALAPALAVGRGRLPGRCPQCGAPLRSDQVEWVDAQSAECPYCGGVVGTDRRAARS